ncbi:MAG: GNAT family N-acetyltransferase [Rhodospirillales bacterium 69-11]|nr:MAG: GNAT family N-acetyltransferase [Rhodospirillales bacterium 69-11]
MQDSMTIRASSDDDLRDITAIYAHHVRFGTASFELAPPSLAEMTTRRAAILERGMPYLVAAEGGAVLAYAYAGPYRARPAYADTVENSIYVRHDLTGRGIGRPLLAALVDACADLGLRQMIAVVGDSGNQPSIRLHERCGFRQIGTLCSVGWKHGRWLDSVLLQRALGQGDRVPPTRPH